MPSPFGNDDTTANDAPVADATPSDMPPRRTRRQSVADAAAATKAKAKAVKTLTSDAIAKGASDLVARVGASGYVYATFKNDVKLQYDTAVIAENAEEIGKAIAMAAEKSPKFKRSLEKLANVTEYTGIAGVAMAVVVPIAWNHDLIPFKNVIGQWIKHPSAAPTVDAKTEEAVRDIFTPPAPVEDQPPVMRQNGNGAVATDSLV